MQAPDAIVIGAGVVGTACAWRLAADSRRVLVLDPREPGSVATAAGMGHIVLIDDAEPRFALTRYGRELWAKLGPELPADAAFRTPGTIWVAQNAAELEQIRRKAARLADSGVACELLDEAGLRRAEPRLRPGLPGGMRVLDDAIVHAPAAARWMLSKAIDSGCAFQQHEVAALREGAVVLGDGTRVAAPLIIVAAGTESPRLLPDLPIRPRKGHLILTGPGEAFCRHEIIEMAYLAGAHGQENESIALNVQPRAEGRVLIGASRQYGTTDDAIEERIVVNLLSRAASYLPGIERAPIERIWTGFRAATPDGLPLVGAHPGIVGVLVASGHEGLGITTAIATGQLIADLAAKRTPAVGMAAFDPGRKQPWSFD